MLLDAGRWHVLESYHDHFSLAQVPTVPALPVRPLVMDVLGAMTRASSALTKQACPKTCVSSMIEQTSEQAR
jgi:hypothetical protein